MTAQPKIVRRVAGLFALADQLEVRLAKAHGHVDRLTPSLLAPPSAANASPKPSRMNRQRNYWKGSKHE